MVVFCKIAVLACVLMFCSCAHRVTKTTERVVVDTTIMVVRDSVCYADTLKRTERAVVMDSVRDSSVTFVVVDTNGKIVSKTTYRERNVYHNKDALIADVHVQKQTTEKQQMERRRTEESLKEGVKVVKPPCVRWWLGVGVFVAMGVLLYFCLYKKRK